MSAFRRMAAIRTWLPGVAWRQLVEPLSRPRRAQLIIALADHFEPIVATGSYARPASADEQERLVERWCRLYPAAADRWRDASGRPFRHT